MGRALSRALIGRALGVLGLALGALSAVSAAPRAAIAEPAIVASGELVGPENPAPYAVPPEYGVEVGPWFTVAFHPNARERVERLFPKIGEARAELEWALGRPLIGDVAIRVAGLDVELSALATRDGEAPIDGDFARPSDIARHGGAAVVGDRLIVLSAGAGVEGDPRELEVSLRYQLARIALSDALVGTNAAVPAWFEEGFATSFARESTFKRNWILLGAALSGDLPHVGELGAEGDANGRSPALMRAFAAEVARYAQTAADGRALRRLVGALRSGDAFDAALDRATGSILDPAVREIVSGRLAWVLVATSSTAIGLGLFAAVWVARRRRWKARRALRRAVREPALELLDPALRDLFKDQLGVDELDLDGHGRASIEAQFALQAALHASEQAAPTHVKHDGEWHRLH